MLQTRFDELPLAFSGSPVRVLHVGGRGMFPQAYVFWAFLVDDGETVYVRKMDYDPDFPYEDEPY